MVCLSVPIINLSQQLPTNISEILKLCYNKGLLRDLSNISIDIYTIIHSPWNPTPCFFEDCHSTNEANILPHAWTFGVDDTYSLSMGNNELLVQLYTGLFEVDDCIRTTHMETGGIPIDRLSLRPKLAHHGRFSPNNNNFRIVENITNNNPYPCFYSIIVDKVIRRAVITLHVLPLRDEAGDKLRDILKKCLTIHQLCSEVYPIIPKFINHLIQLYTPVWGELPDDLYYNIYRKPKEVKDKDSNNNTTQQADTNHHHNSNATSSSSNTNPHPTENQSTTNTNINKLSNISNGTNNNEKEEGEVTPPVSAP